MAENINHDFFSMIIYSRDNGSIWALSEGAPSADRCELRIAEWEGSLLMATRCHGGRTVYESRDVGKHGRGPSGHSQACGRRHKRKCSSQIGLLGPSSPRPLRNGKSCFILRKGFLVGRKIQMRFTFGSRTTTARFLFDRLLRTMPRRRRFPAPCCTWMAIGIFYGRGTAMRGTGKCFLFAWRGN
ncbi:putative trans-sialidase [Trypanosoma cruzi]|nr:putative trans-sialidase [Trypanosoma cruzi]